jgi:hypothetical protein
MKSGTLQCKLLQFEALNTCTHMLHATHNQSMLKVYRKHIKSMPRHTHTHTHTHTQQRHDQVYHNPHAHTRITLLPHDRPQGEQPANVKTARQASLPRLRQAGYEGVLAMQGCVVLLYQGKLLHLTFSVRANQTNYLSLCPTHRHFLSFDMHVPCIDRKSLSS